MRLKILGLQGADSLELVRIVTKNVSTENLAAILSTTGLTDAQKKQLLVDRELEGEKLKEALATATSSAANVGATATTGALTGATVSLSTALKGLWATLMANPLVLVAAGITTVITLHSKYQRSLEDTAQAASEQTQKTKASLESLQSLKTRVDAGTESTDTLTDAFREQLKEMGYTKEEIDTLINRYDNLADAIDNVTEKTRAQTLADAKAEAVAQKQAAKGEFGWFKGLNKGSGINGRITGANYETGEEYFWYEDVKFFSKEDEKNILDAYESLRDAYHKAQSGTIEDIILYQEKLEETFGLLKDAALFDDSIYDNFYYKAVESQLQYVEKEFGDYIDAVKYANSLEEEINKTFEETAEIVEDVSSAIQGQAAELKASFTQLFAKKDSELLNYIDIYVDKVSDLQTALTKLRNGGLKPEELNTLYKAFPELAGQADNLDDAISKIIETLRTDAAAVFGEQIDNMITEEYRAAAEEYFGNLLKMGDVTNHTADTMSRLSDTISEIEKGKDILKTATEEMKENGEISNDTLKSIIELMDAGEKWVDYIELENGQLKLNVEMWQEKIKSPITLELTNLENELRILQNETDEITKQIALYKTRETMMEQNSSAVDYLKIGRKSTLPSNINESMLWSPYDQELKEKVDATKELKDNIEVYKALLNNLDREIADTLSGNGSSNKSEPKRYNWIETAIDRIKRKIDSFSRTVSNKVKSLSKRNDAAKEEISAITEEIELQQRAYEKYLKLADSVNISDALKERIRKGAIEIEEYDEETAELIDRYKEFYEAALDAKDSVDELHESLTELHDDEFNRIQTDFENRISLLEYLSNVYDTGISTLETKGYMASTEFYTALTTATEHNIELLKEELASLQAAFSAAMDSGEVEEYSEAW